MGDHLKRRRYELGLRQKDVATRLSVNEYTVCQWENNKKRPSIRYLPSILGFLGFYPFKTPQTLADRLLACRRCLGLSRREMAQKLCVDEGTLARWEKGEARPTGKLLAVVREFLLACPSSVPLGER